MTGRRRGATPRDDQIEAAEAEVQHNLRATARDMRVPLSTHVNGDGNDPVLDGMLQQIRTATVAGELAYCPHVRSPQPMFLDWWRKPWMVRCSFCNQSAARASELEDNTCDNCGHASPDGTWPTHVALGVVMLSVGRCDDCTPFSARPPHRSAEP